MSRMKVELRVPTVGHKRGAVIEVEKEQAEALIANGSARPAKVAPKSDKD